MESVVLVIHLIIAVSIIILVLLQRSEGGGLGIGGSSGGGGGMGGFATARTTADFLTRATGILAGLFMVTSLTLAVLAGNHSTKKETSILDVDTTSIEAPIATDAAAMSAPVAVPVSGESVDAVVKKVEEIKDTAKSVETIKAVEPAVPVSE